jgi:hypothetical protein
MINNLTWRVSAVFINCIKAGRMLSASPAFLSGFYFILLLFIYLIRLLFSDLQYDTE